MKDHLLQGSMRSGEEHPTAGVLVATRRKEFLNTILGEDVFDNRDVYVVGAQGNFTLGDASTPGSDVAPPSGHFLFIVFDANTLEGVDGGVLSKPPDFSDVGSVMPLDLSTAGS